MDSGTAQGTIFVVLWIASAALSIFLFQWSRKRYPKERISTSANNIRPLLLVGLVPCFGITIVVTLIYFGIFMGKVKVDQAIQGNAERRFQQRLGAPAPASPNGNPFGGGQAPAARQANPFGAPPSAAPASTNPFGSPSASQAEPNPFGSAPSASTGEPNPFGSPDEGGRGGSSKNPFAD